MGVVRAFGGLLLVAAAISCDVRPVERAPPVDPKTEADKTPAPEPTPPAPEPATQASRLVLVTMDGVRWEDAFDGSMPNLSRLVAVEGIAVGGPECANGVLASGPNFVSLPGYMEMFGGKATACTHNYCPPVDDATVIDDVEAAHPGEVAVFSSWGRYANAVAKNRKAILLSAGANGYVPSPKTDPKLKSYLGEGAAHMGYPGWGDYRPDVHTARIAFRYLEVMHPRLLVVGLGDADEQAHRGDIAGYRRAIKRADEYVGNLEQVLARMGDDGKDTAVIVTTDHGRAHSLRTHGSAWPESQHVFFAAFGAGISHKGTTCATQPLHLADLAGAMRSVLVLDANGHWEQSPLAAEILASKSPELSP